MYGGGRNCRPGGDAGCVRRVCVTPAASRSASAGQVTRARSVWMGSILAFATVLCGRTAFARQQSLALPCGAHVSSPSLQHAICGLIVGIAASAHAAHNDQLKVVATARITARTVADRNVIIGSIAQGFFFADFSKRAR